MADQSGEDVPEAGADPTTKELLQWIGKAAYWIVYPIAITIYHTAYYISFGAVFVVKLLYRPLEFILLPVVYLAQFIFNCILAPFRFLARFEVRLDTEIMILVIR